MAAVKSLSIKKWWEDYAENPFDALDRLLCGRVSMGYLERNETNEIIFRLFHDKSNKTRGQLDMLMKDWFAANWGNNPDPADIVPSRWANILQNAFIAVYRLNLAETALFLREIYTRERSWVRSLYIGPHRDPEGNLLQILALLQKDRKLLPLWMSKRIL